MLYGFIDESGASGTATRPNDYLAASLVICDSLEVVQEIQNIIALHRVHNNLPPDYEFHCSSNSVAQQERFVRLIATLDFKFTTVAIKKDDFRGTATYAKISESLIKTLKIINSPMKIKMDSNPSFYKALKQTIKRAGIYGVQIRESKSKSMDLLQVVDYVVNISVKKLKGKKTGRLWYPLIKNKRID